MISRDYLLELSEEELESLYQKKKTEFDDKLSKNRRIRAMLNRKVEQLSKKVQALQQEMDDIAEAHPDVVKVKIDDELNYENNPNELISVVQRLQTELSVLKSQKLQISNSITEITLHINEQKEREKDLEKQIEELVLKTETIAKNGAGVENEELTALYQEEISIKDEISRLIKEVEDIRRKIHHHA